MFLNKSGKFKITRIEKGLFYDSYFKHFKYWDNKNGKHKSYIARSAEQTRNIDKVKLLIGEFVKGYITDLKH